VRMSMCNACEVIPWLVQPILDDGTADMHGIDQFSTVPRSRRCCKWGLAATGWLEWFVRGL
jgi:hypothetical protein